MTFKYALKFITGFAENKLNGCEAKFTKTGLEAVSVLRKQAEPCKELLTLLDECDAALSASSSNVMNPDLAIACLERARRCREMISKLK